MSAHIGFDVEGNCGQAGGLSTVGVRQKLLAQIVKERNVRAWCLKHNIKSTGPVHEFLAGLRRPGKDVLDALDLEKRYVYVRRL